MESLEEVEAVAITVAPIDLGFELRRGRGHRKSRGLGLFGGVAGGRGLLGGRGQDLSITGTRVQKIKCCFHSWREEGDWET